MVRVTHIRHLDVHNHHLRQPPLIHLNTIPEALNTQVDSSPVQVDMQMDIPPIQMDTSPVQMDSSPIQMDSNELLHLARSSMMKIANWPGKSGSSKPSCKTPNIRLSS